MPTSSFTVEMTSGAIKCQKPLSINVSSCINLLGLSWTYLGGKYLGGTLNASGPLISWDLTSVDTAGTGLCIPDTQTNDVVMFGYSTSIANTCSTPKNMRITYTLTLVNPATWVFFGFPFPYGWEGKVTKPTGNVSWTGDTVTNPCPVVLTHDFAIPAYSTENATFEFICQSACKVVAMTFQYVATGQFLITEL